MFSMLVQRQRAHWTIRPVIGLERMDPVWMKEQSLLVAEATSDTRQKPQVLLGVSPALMKQGDEQGGNFDKPATVITKAIVAWLDVKAPDEPVASVKAPDKPVPSAKAFDEPVAPVQSRQPTANPPTSA